MRTKVTDDDNFQYVRASLNTQEQEDSQFKGSDPFNKNWGKLSRFFRNFEACIYRPAGHLFNSVCHRTKKLR